MKTKELKEKIQELIKKNDKDYKEVIKRRWDFLYKKLDEVKEIETLEHLKKQKKQAGDKFLKAYLLYKSISRANYQPEHLNLTNFKKVEKYLEAIDKDIELVKQEIEAKPVEPSNEKLLTLLGERIRVGEIKSWWSGAEYINSLFVENEKGEEIICVDLDTGKIEPDRTKELLEKHGWEDKEEK